MKVRTITTAEGRYLNLPDMCAQLRNPEYLKLFPALLKVGHDKDDSPETICAYLIGSALADWVGDVKFLITPTPDPKP